MIVITTPTGHIGSQLLPHLLAAHQAVRVIARDPAKIPEAIRSKVEVVTGSVADPAVLARALEGAESLFWVVPPDFQVADPMEQYRSLTAPAVEAVKAKGVKRVVSVSSLGRGHGRNAGIIAVSHAKDELFEASGVHFRALWNPGFMENMLMQLGPLKQKGMFFAPGKPDLKLPHAATRDIAASAARLLLDTSWTGKGGLAVLGPADISPNEQAAIMSEVLGKPIRFQQITGAAHRETMIARGASPAMAQSLVEMHAAIDEGLYNHEVRTVENTTPTTFRWFCEEILRPAFLR